MKCSYPWLLHIKITCQKLLESGRLGDKKLPHRWSTVRILHRHAVQRAAAPATFLICCASAVMPNLLQRAEGPTLSVWLSRTRSQSRTHAFLQVDFWSIIYGKNK